MIISKKMLLLAAVGLIGLPAYGMHRDPMSKGIYGPGIKVLPKLRIKVDEESIKEAQALWLRDYTINGDKFLDTLLKVVGRLAKEEMYLDILLFIATQWDQVEELFYTTKFKDEKAFNTLIKKILSLYRMQFIGPILIKAPKVNLAKK